MRYKIGMLASFVTIFILLSHVYSIANADTENKQTNTGSVIITKTGLSLQAGGEIQFAPGADMNERTAMLADEIEKLKIVAMRATLIVFTDWENTGKTNNDRVEVTLSGGRLEKPVPCVTGQFGICTYIVEPLTEKDPAYKVSVRKEGAAVTEKDVRVESAEVAIIPIRLGATKRNLVVERPRVRLSASFLDNADSTARFTTFRRIADTPYSEMLDPAFAAPVLEAITGADESVKSAAADALGRLYIEGHVTDEKIIELLQDQTLTIKVRLRIASAFSRVAGPVNADFLKTLLKTGTPDERRFATGMIVYQGVDVAAPALIEALADPDDSVRANAVEQLQYISSGQNFNQDAAAWLSWWDEVSKH